VYERFARQWMGRQDQLHTTEAEESVVSVARLVFAEWERRVPAPNAAAVQAEWEWVEQSARSFLLMERDSRGLSWVACEVELLADGRRPKLRLPDGSELAVWGRIDRVDRRKDGSLIVIDFKTGSTYGYAAGGKGGPFRGGRQLQSGVYALAAEQLFGARVVAFEYRFPTPRGENHVTRHDRALLDSAGDTILGLLRQIERGEFLPTMDEADCGYCDFRDICRVRDGDFHKVQSPRAEWAKRVGESDPRYQQMRQRRGEEPA
jgi:ATP-dependent helicase/nuclease subunit B